MELKVGMYVRTDKGFINKIKEFTPNYTKGKRKTSDYSVVEVEENYLLLEKNQCEFIESINYSIPPCYPSNEELEEIKGHIIKSSFNIVDLIEVGDYVNGSKVLDIYLHDDKDKSNCYCTDEMYFFEKDIKSIVTKEQFKSMEYRIGDTNE